MVGDGFCNDEVNNANCNFDGEDCCFNVNKDRCTECTCYLGEFCAAGFIPSIVGDGYCNDEVNIEECNYDHGDCCGSCINTEYCIKCACLSNITGHEVLNPLIRDGYCNDETNNVLCSFDGLDCCRHPVNTEFCSECSCHGLFTKYIIKFNEELKKILYKFFFMMYNFAFGPVETPQLQRSLKCIWLCLSV